MPSSVTLGKPFIYFFVKEILKSRQFLKFLDVGVGLATYPKMFRERLPPACEFVGVEIWAPYVKEFALDYWYDSLIIGDARSLNWSSVPPSNIVLLGDVLEHMTRLEAVVLVEKASLHADFVIISIPLGNHPQGAECGNPWETHVAENWTADELHILFKDKIGVHIHQFIGVTIVCGKSTLVSEAQRGFVVAEQICRVYEKEIAKLDLSLYPPMLDLLVDIESRIMNRN